jgi:hypothetical protein
VYIDGNTSIISENESEDDSKDEDRAIQLISQNTRGDLVLNNDALNIIKEIKNKVAVFVVVGPYRQGKSYILNRLLDRSSGFKVGHTDNSCTKGIWMWNKVIRHTNRQNETMDIIYLDTEVKSILNQILYSVRLLFFFISKRELNQMTVHQNGTQKYFCQVF